MQHLKLSSINLQESDEELLQKMPKKFTTVIRGRSQGRSYPEIAELNNIPIGTVRSRLNRARNMLIKLRTERNAHAEVG